MGRLTLNVVCQSQKTITWESYMKLLKHLSANDIKLTELPFRMELSMEAYLIENPSVLILDNDNFSEIEIVQAELPIKNGRGSKKSDGRIDILAAYNQKTLAIIELKLGQLNNSHLDQLEDYMKCKEELITQNEKLLPEKSQDENFDWIGILVGNSIEENLKQKVLTGYKIENKIPLAALTITRYRSADNFVYVLTNTYFNEDSSRNTNKYLFNGQVYSKSRLVLAVLKKYVEDNPRLTFSNLKNVFPDKLQGNKWGVFTSLTEANQVYDSTGYKRHFIKPEEIITLADQSEIAVCSNWGINNINDFLKKVNNLNYPISLI